MRHIPSVSEDALLCPVGEEKELTTIYVQRGLDRKTWWWPPYFDQKSECANIQLIGSTRGAVMDMPPSPSNTEIWCARENLRRFAQLIGKARDDEERNRLLKLQTDELTRLNKLLSQD
jgi:hypothetical protein